MIKIFRKIRQNLLVENKTRKYFKYAIGEILLVFIGILIALQVSNWNTGRIDSVEEQKALQSLYSELNSSEKKLSQKLFSLTKTASILEYLL
jgi:hypothetical protein